MPDLSGVPGLRRFSRSHAARFESTVVHFTMTVQVDRRLDIVRGARRLLNSDLAVSAAWPSDADIRVNARKLRPLAKSIRRTRAMFSNYEHAVDEGGVAAMLGLLIRHPSFIPPVVRAMRASHIERAARREQIDVFSNKSGHLANELNADGTVESDAGSLVEKPREMVSQVEQDIMGLQVVSAAERMIDASLFGGRDRDEDRFVRLLLQNSYHDLVIPGAQDTQRVVFEPRLLMHESGVVQLDLRLSARGPMTADQVIELMWGPAPRIARSEMTEPTLNGSGWESAATGVREEGDAGRRLALIEHPEPASMTEALHAHLGAVMLVLRRSYGSWLNYPVAMIKPGGCCKPSRWRTNHAADVHRIAIRGQGIKRIADHVTPPPDLSMKADHSLFSILGSTTYFQWRGDVPFGLDELDTVLVIEYAVLVYMRLQTLEERVSRISLGERRIRRRFRDAMILFSELRQGDLRAGESRGTVDHLLAELGADRMRQTIQSALELASMAHATVSAERAARRTWWITLLATMVAALVAVPPLWDLLRAVEVTSADQVPAWVLKPLHWIASFEFFGPWVLIGLMIASVLLLMLVGWLIRHWPRVLPGIHKGYAWPKRFTAISDHQAHYPPD